MARDRNPWCEWVGDGLFAHPDAPCRAGGGVIQADVTGFHRRAISPWSPAGEQLSPSEAAAGYALHELDGVLDGLRESIDAEQLHRVALEAFGLGSHSVRFGDALRHAGINVGLLSLHKTILAAELHDHLRGARRWSRSETWSTSFPPRLRQTGQYLRATEVRSLCDLEGLERMAQTRATLLDELQRFLNQPTPVFVEARAKLDPRTAEHWQRHNELLKTRLSQGDAGWHLAQACLKVLPAISTSMHRGDFAARIASAAPVLTKFAMEMKDDAAGTSGALAADTDAENTPAIDPRARIPYHNNEMLEPKVESGSFKTERGIDMNNLSPEEKKVQKILKGQGRNDPEDQKQLLRSGSNFENQQLRKGDKLYAFDSAGHKKPHDSMYWLDEKGFADVKARHCKAGVWNKEGVKNELALPCYNRANTVVQPEVTADHTAIRSKIAPATEQVCYSKPGFTSDYYTKPLPGGGTQITPSASNITQPKVIT